MNMVEHGCSFWPKFKINISRLIKGSKFNENRAHYYKKELQRYHGTIVASNYSDILWYSVSQLVGRDSRTKTKMIAKPFWVGRKVCSQRNNMFCTLYITSLLYSERAKQITSMQSCSHVGFACGMMLYILFSKISVHMFHLQFMLLLFIYYGNCCSLNHQIPLNFHFVLLLHIFKWLLWLIPTY